MFQTLPFKFPNLLQGPPVGVCCGISLHLLLHSVIKQVSPLSSFSVHSATAVAFRLSASRITMLPFFILVFSATFRFLLMFGMVVWTYSRYCRHHHALFTYSQFLNSSHHTFYTGTISSVDIFRGVGANFNSP